MLVNVTFWLLDINPKNDKVTGTSELWLWGIDANGNRVLVIDRNFTSYFYVMLQDGAEASKVVAIIDQNYSEAVVGTEVVKRRFFGKPVTAIKVYCKVATETGRLAKQIRSIEGVRDCLEDDVRIAMRYLIDNDIVPCSWHEVKAEEDSTEDIRVDKVFAASSPPRQIDNSSIPSLRVLAFSMLCYSREGSPLPDRNPVIIISTATNSGEERQFTADEKKDDAQLIADFFNYISQFDPDVIVSFGANTVDWAYLKARCRKLNLKMSFDRAKQEPHTSVYGHVSATGIVNIDLEDFVNVFPEVKVKTLWNLAEHLGIPKDGHSWIEDVEFPDLWDDENKRGQLLRFGLDGACKVQSITILLSDFAMQLSSLVSLPLDHVMAAATGFRVEWFLIKRAQKRGEIIPKRTQQPYIPYVGGLVLSPKPGLHDNIAVLDFKSMYPNIMLTYNLSPDTYVAPGEPEPESGVYVAPELGHRFRKSPSGFYTEALTYLINLRNLIRKRMKTVNPKTVEYRVLDAKQKAVKITTNAAYGYAGWVGARWYIKPVAEAASAWGRHMILAAEKMAENAGILVVYGDTDSLFIGYEKLKAEKLQKQVEHELELEVEIGEIYKRIFFTEAKKRYAGLRKDGSLDIVGLEVIRGDWAGIAKKVQEHVLETILNESSAQKAIEYVRDTVKALRQRKVPFNDLIIWKTLSKAPQNYNIKAPHVEAAKMLIEKGWRLTSGDKVGYVILKGKGQLYRRVKPYIFADYEEVDVDYYVTNQVLPSALRILQFFNITPEELFKKETAKTEERGNLMDYV